MNNSQEYTKIENSWINNKEFPIKRMKYLVNFIRGIEPGSKNYGIEGEGKRFIRVNDIGSNNKNNVYVKVETDAVCNNGDILLCLDGSPGIITREMEGIFSTGLRKLKLKEDALDYDYLFYSLSCDFVQEAIQFFSKGTTIMHASDVTNYLKQPLPDLATQKIIVNFLNEKTKKIDKVIENMNHQVRLLNENLSIVINESCRKSISDKADLRDTHIDWVGKIVSTWKLARLKNITKKIGSGKTPKGGSANYPDKGVLFIRSQNVHFEKFKLDGIKYISQETHLEMKNTSVFPGDVLLNITGASIGRTCLFPNELKEANVSQHVCIIRSEKNKLIPRFLLYYLHSNSGKANVWRNYEGASKEGLNFKHISLFKIPIPELEEQEKIVKYLDEKTSKIQRAIKLIKKETLRLEEYKKILINDAVTGRIKVSA